MDGDKLLDQQISEMMTFDARILELVSPNSLLDVPVDPKIDNAVLVSDDDNPMFVNVEVIRTGVSKTNRRRYNNPVVREISDMTPGLQGFLGHPDPMKEGFEFREPQTIFVGSTVQEMADGGSRSIAKAYIFKSSPLREWIPKSIAAGNPMTVSINGRGDIIRNGDILDVVHMSEVQSIDWANPGTEGMPTSQAMSIVKELQDNKGGNDEMAEAKDILKNATITEFKAYNPDGYTGVIKSISVTELQAHNPELVKQIQESGRITEMQLTIDGKSEMVALDKVQGVLIQKEQRVTELQGEVEGMKITEYKNKKLVELVPETLREMVGKRVTGKTEKEVDESINTEIAYIKEMGAFDNLPVGGSQRKDADGIKDAVRNLFGVKKEEEKK